MLIKRLKFLNLVHRILKKLQRYLFRDFIFNNFFQVLKHNDYLSFQWVSETSPNSSMHFKMDGPLQFVPKNTNPIEFKKLQKQVCLFII